MSKRQSSVADRIAGIIVFLFVIFGLNGFSLGYRYFAANAKGQLLTPFWTIPDGWSYLVAIATAVMFNAIIRLRSARALSLLVALLLAIIVTSLIFLVGTLENHQFCTNGPFCQGVGIVCFVALVISSAAYLVWVEFRNSESPDLEGENLL